MSSTSAWPPRAPTRSRRTLGIGIVALLLGASPAGRAEEHAGGNAPPWIPGWFDSVYVQAGVSTHWDDDEDYTGTPYLGGLEAVHDDRHLFGISLFNNSYSQFCQYYYYGYQFPLTYISESLHLKVTGGLIHGYVDESEDALALNADGWAPVIIPSLGWKRERLGFDIAVLGDAGVMFLVGYDLWRR